MSDRGLAEAFLKTIGRAFEVHNPHRLGGALSDPELIELTRLGHVGAFSQLVKRYENFVYTLVRGIVLRREEAEDITQEVFLRAYHGIRRFESRSSFKTWLYRIAYNTSLSQLNKRKKECALDDLPEPLASSTQSSRWALRKMIDRLKPELKAVVILHYYDDLKYEEISEILSCPIGTVKIRLFRAKYELRNLWEKYAVRL